MAVAERGSADKIVPCCSTTLSRSRAGSARCRDGWRKSSCSRAACAGPSLTRSISRRPGCPANSAKGASGSATLRAAMAETGAPAPSLDIRDVDAALERVSKLRGSGSAAERLRLLRELFVHATRAEQEFLVHLVLGELRQGALEGLMIEAVARAAEIP